MSGRAEEVARERLDFCGKVIERVRELARGRGYAIGVHGSQHRDLDLIAAPWAESVSAPDDLAEAIAAEFGWTHDWRVERPHGRLGYTVYFAPEEGRPALPRYIDLSVFPSASGETGLWAWRCPECGATHQRHLGRDEGVYCLEHEHEGPREFRPEMTRISLVPAPVPVVSRERER